MSPVNFPPPSLRRQVARNVAVRDTCLRSPFRDRKSTRLNSSHGYKSYAVFCLKKKEWTDLFSVNMALDDPKLKQAAETYGKMLNYQHTHHSALTWDQAVKAVMEGRCAFTSMGDWTYGEFAKAKMKDNFFFGWVAPPGTYALSIIVAVGF